MIGARARVRLCVSYLDPGVDSAELVDKLRPLVNHLNNLLLLHERERDVRPGVETHDLTGRQQGAPSIQGEMTDISI